MREQRASSRRRFELFLSGGERPTRAPERAFEQPLTRVSRARIGRYLAWVRPQARALAVVSVLSLLGMGIDMVWPLASAYLFDRVILNPALGGAEKQSQILRVGLLVVVLFGIGSGLSWLRTLRVQLMNGRFSFELRRRLFEHVLRLPLSELNELSTGGILSRLSTDVDNTTGLLQQALLSPVFAGLRLVATLAIVFSLNAALAAAVLVALPPVLLLQLRYAGRLRPIWRSLARDRQDIDGRVSEGLSGLRVVRSFRREKLEELAYGVGHHTVIRKQLLATEVQRGLGTIWELLLPLTQVVIVCFGGHLVIQGRTSVGVLVAVQAYVWRVFDPILQIANSISGTQRGLVALDRVVEILDKPAELPDVDGAESAAQRVDAIEFDRVNFEYRPGMPVIRDFSLSVPGGSVVALVGASGAGKTTLTDLIARFRDPTSGCLRVNGRDLRQLSLRSYRRLIGIVSQEVFLFDGTVAENIAYGARTASREAIERAARRANAHDFIQELPEGYASLIGERGVKLSGGQRQRLSIARALLADPQILILDEATSNLDSESERLIQASLYELFSGRTTFVIAHRLSTVVDANCIVVLDRGRIVESGTHAELLARRGTYHAMLQHQWRAPIATSEGVQLAEASDADGSTGRSSERLRYTE